MKTLFALGLGCVLIALAPPARSEEGMWTFDDIPAARVERSLGVRLDRVWLGHLRGASVRLSTGCSAALVSRQGLTLTNQHCVLACAQGLSSPEADYLRDGFLTDGLADERRCPGMQAEILLSIADVTDPIYAAARGKWGEAYVIAREGAIARAERSACHGDPRLRCQVIGFFGDGEFKVYKYRKYDDVRLVFAPEMAAAFFGGDPDNFTFPRFDLDAAFLRLYEAGRPAVTPGALAWSRTAPAAGEAVFVSGNPAATERGFTLSQLESERDIALPASIEQHAELRARLRALAAAGESGRRIVAAPLFDQENDLKAFAGRLAVLRDPDFLAARQRDEEALRARLAATPKLAAEIGNPWAEIAAAQKAFAARYPLWRQIELGAGGGSQRFAWARLLVRAATERPKPTAERLPEYADSRLALLERTALDDRPAPAALDRLYLEAWLERTVQVLGADSPEARDLLAGETPRALAARLTDASELASPDVRRTLWLGGAAAIEASHDPMIAFVLRTDAAARSARAAWEDEVSGPIERASERIARVRFAVQGQDLYPDATFSLRLSYGKVAGWGAGAGAVGPFTTIGGLYQRATDVDPFRLSPRWKSAKPDLDPGVVLDFATTNDITGGNSGSPVVNARGDIVGAAFDGNAASLAGDFAYDGAVNRTVVVSTAAIDEALAKVYGRTALVAELDSRIRRDAAPD